MFVRNALLTAMGSDEALRVRTVELHLVSLFAAAEASMRAGGVEASGRSTATFLSALHLDRTLAAWVRSVARRVFVLLFLVLRAARLAWHAKPRPPFDVAQHGALAKAIDAFEAVSRVEWAQVEVVQDLLAGLDLKDMAAADEKVKQHGLKVDVSVLSEALASLNLQGDIKDEDEVMDADDADKVRKDGDKVQKKRKRDGQ
ncbi:hypothetical protein B0H63DRAFT_84702 [Podospora didyma]|uniref:Uncharacterized protein n=1 Tax=Podospora didyma TaxID=330526 RepID=A0AAE0K0A1_9PEZI|nr:hypothetical protein B0H63DRAFT_84702 [Podospora didyma]